MERLQGCSSEQAGQSEASSSIGRRNWQAPFAKEQKGLRLTRILTSARVEYARGKALDYAKKAIKCLQARRKSSVR